MFAINLAVSVSFHFRTIANYIALRVFISNLKYMSFSIRRNLNHFIQFPTDSGDQYATELDRWKFCVSWIADNMQYPLGMMYVDNMWPKIAADEVNERVKFYIFFCAHTIRNNWMNCYKICCIRYTDKNL